jgi:hypothetical protein
VVASEEAAVPEKGEVRDDKVENDIVTRQKLGPAGKIDLGFLANRRL